MKLKKIIKNPWFISLFSGLIFFVLGFIYKDYIRTQGDYSPGMVKGIYNAGDKVSKEINQSATGDKSIQVVTTGDNSPVSIAQEYKFRALEDLQKVKIITKLSAIRNKYSDKKIEIEFQYLGNDRIANSIVSQLRYLINDAGFKTYGTVLAMHWPHQTMVKVRYHTSFEKIAEEILDALSLAITGKFDKDIEDTYRKDGIFIYIEGEPEFNEFGQAVFR